MTTAVKSLKAAVYAQAYGAIAEWILYPEEVDEATLKGERLANTLSCAADIGPEVVDGLQRFKDEWGTFSEEEYLNLLELNPRCPLYTGTHLFEEPTTCSAAGLSDRNTYMLEIGNIYRHFGFQLKGELPDYLPAMIEFLALTAESEGDDIAVRMRLVVLLMADGVKLVAEKLNKEKGPYGYLVSSLAACIEAEMRDYPETENLLEQGVGQQEPVQQLIQIEGASTRE